MILRIKEVFLYHFYYKKLDINDFYYRKWFDGFYKKKVILWFDYEKCFFLILNKNWFYDFYKKKVILWF